MTDTLTIATTSTVMRGKSCILEIDLEVEVECDEGTSFEVKSFRFDDGAVVGPRDTHLFAVLREGLNRDHLLDEVASRYRWKTDSETGYSICMGLAS